jgi:hypothetical protein
VTLAVVFLRRVLSHYELVFGADTRLSGGQVNDHAQKIFTLPRNDALFAFAGDTRYAYPLMMQLLRSVESYPLSVDRKLPLPKLKGHALRVFQQSYAAIHSLPVGQKYPEDPDNYFLLGGYDWLAQRFRTWVLHFDHINRQFAFELVVPRKAFYFIGDDEDARSYARAETQRLLRSRGRTVREINAEPLEVLSQIIRDPAYPAIGGTPQIGKAYQHLNTQLFQVRWAREDSTPASCHIAGRPLLPNERCSWPIFDPEHGFYAYTETGSLEPE